MLPTENPVFMVPDRALAAKYLDDYQMYEARLLSQGTKPIGHKHCVDLPLLRTTFEFAGLTAPGKVWEKVASVDELTDDHVLAWICSIAVPATSHHLPFDVGATVAKALHWDTKVDALARVSMLFTEFRAFRHQHSLDNYYAHGKPKLAAQHLLAAIARTDSAFSSHVTMQIQFTDPSILDDLTRLFNTLVTLAHQWDAMSKHIEHKVKADMANVECPPKPPAPNAKPNAKPNAPVASPVGRTDVPKDPRGCLKCHGSHFVADCPDATAAEKKQLVADFRAKLKLKQRPDAPPQAATADVDTVVHARHVRVVAPPASSLAQADSAVASARMQLSEAKIAQREAYRTAFKSSVSESFVPVTEDPL